MQGGGISNSASRGKGDLPFPHENRRDVTLCGVSMFFLPAGVFGNPLAPFLLPLPPQKGEGGGAKRRRTWVWKARVR